MKAAEFCYWLQGYFELSCLMEVPRLQEKQVECIRAHLALVAKVDPNHDNMFVEWLSKSLDNASTAANTAKIRRMLASQFQHVIDGSYGGSANELHSIHNGHGSMTGGMNPNPLVRC